MEILNLKNPFAAPVYYEETVSSTMDVSRVLARKGGPHGTVIFSDFQEAGRGRAKRPWVMEKGRNLIFTILLRYGDFSMIPAALTLKAGLAISLAVEDSFPALSGRVEVKWPNDIMLGAKNSGRKAAGILAEAEDSTVFLGVGVNLAQRDFPEEIRNRAVSVVLALEEIAGGKAAVLPPGARTLLLEKILFRLYNELEDPSAAPWRPRLEGRLYKKGEEVVFVDGAADSGREVRGRLEGVGPGGELLLVPAGENAPRAFVTGQLKVYNQAGQL